MIAKFGLVKGPHFDYEITLEPHKEKNVSVVHNRG